MSLDDEARAELRQLADSHRLRVPLVVDGACGPTVRIDGVELINASSNDYLGLAGDARLVEAAKAALDEVGVGAGASRLITGTQRHHVALERAIADWMRCDGVRVFNSGYAANGGVLTALLSPGDLVFSDALNHASIIDGCRLSRAEIVVFPHRDADALDRALRSRPGRRRLVVTESLFSMDGDLADVSVIAELCMQHGAIWMLDEAHAMGARGPEGRGVAASEGVVPDLLVGTFGKALGVSGAFVASTAAVAELLWNKARPFVFSTAMPAAIAAAAMRAIEIVRGSDGKARREQLAAHARRLRATMRFGGEPDAAIAPLVLGDDARVMAMSAQLFERGVLAQGIRPPTVPEGTARLRISLSSGHSAQQLDKLSQELHDATRRST